MSTNLALRIAVAVVGIPALWLVAYLGGIYFLTFCILLAALAGLELMLMAGIKDVPWVVLFGIVLPSACPLVAFGQLPLGIPLAVCLLSTAIWAVSRWQRGSFLTDLLAAFLPTSYVGIAVTALIWVRLLSENGRHLVFFLLLSTWATDTAAYFGGKALGKRKLAPRLSPSKTWEGVFFGFVGGLSAAVVAKLTFLQFSWPMVLIIWFVVCLTGLLGDLFESGLKRSYDRKDSSSILPGHGGILDRFDSLLFAAPALYLIVRG